ncbi:ATP synthase, F1 delta subunit [Actinobacteria bacterium IMCC26207]|jgi:F-type H+-transporting ATPase subunit delta|nr:ATP synthase, F1 delta subunit [Actinobacteria bacterium IMCC26207]
MSDTRITAYADAAFAIAQAEGDLAEVEDELFRLGRVLESNDELRSALTDQHVPVSRRQQIIEDLLAGKATQTTLAIVSMIVGAGRAADLVKIANELVQRTASNSGQAVAEVRSAVALTDAQLTELTAALKARTNMDILVKNIVDPSVMGGLVTQIGDSVLDGTVRTRLNQLRDAF